MAEVSRFKDLSPLKEIILKISLIYSARSRLDRVVYIPTYYYLSHPIFFNLAQGSKGQFTNIYFNTLDPCFSRYNEDGIKKEEIIKYFDEYFEIQPPVWNGENKRGFDKYKSLLEFIFRYRKFTAKLEKCLERLDPAAVVTTSDLGGYVNRSCNSWCEKKGIPFIIIQPAPAADVIENRGLRTQAKLKLRYLIFNRVLEVPLFQRQAVYGNERKENYLFLNGNYYLNGYRGREIEKNISIVGNPAVDPILGNTFPKADLRELGLEKAKDYSAIITICTEGLDGIIDERHIDELNKSYMFAVEQNPDLFFVIKVHPRESVETYVDSFKGLSSDNYRILKDINLYQLFTVTDVQISVASTTSLEALVFGIPIVIANPGNNIKLKEVFNGEIELKAESREELSKNIRRSLTEEYRKDFRSKREKYIISRYGYLDGNSSRRVIEKIKEIMEAVKAERIGR